MKPSGIGGQAVIEGVMMKNQDMYAVAIRKPDKEIEVKSEKYDSIIKWKKLTKIPFIRGAFNFIDMMVLGMQTLTYSASFYEEEEESKPSLIEKIWKEKAEKIIMGFTVIFSIVMAVGIFILLPYFISRVLKNYIMADSLLAVIEGVLRLLLFVAYIFAISFMKDIQRVFMYHGSEHKCINCIEHGKELTLENVKASSKEHKRCGTSFMLYVMVISILLFMLIRVDSAVLRVLLRVLLVPVIAGIAYELIRFAGKYDNAFVNVISKPGLWLQGLTTKEPDDDMIEVAIASVEAIFDWKAYLKENFAEAAESTESVEGQTVAAVNTESADSQTVAAESSKSAAGQTVAAGKTEDRAVIINTDVVSDVE